MAKILHSHKYIAYMINQKNAKNYLKDGGAYIVNTKIFQEKNNFFDEVKKFLKEEEQKENMAQETPQEDVAEKKSFDFEKQILEEELSVALGCFNISRANKIKEKLEELKKLDCDIEEK